MGLGLLGLSPSSWEASLALTAALLGGKVAALLSGHPTLQQVGEEVGAWCGGQLTPLWHWGALVEGLGGA